MLKRTRTYGPCFKRVAKGTSRNICDEEQNADREPIDIQGTIKFTDDTDYWQANSFPFVFQNVTSFFKLGGDDVQIYGGVYCLLS